MRELKKGWIFLLLCLLAAVALPAGGERQGTPEEEENVLIYAALNPVTGELEQSIARFNGRHEDVQIEIRDYSDEGGRERLQIELMLGQVPDIMEMHHYGKGGPIGAAYAYYSNAPESYEAPEDEYWMPYRQMAQRGYLEDLWPYIENDPALGREAVMESILKAVEVNGSLPVLFGNVMLLTLSGRESVVGDRYSWTLEDVMDVFASMPEGSTIMRYNLTKWNIYSNLLRFSIEQFVDRSTGECFFDSQSFRDLAGFLEGFPDEVDYEKAWAAEEEIKANIRYGRQMLEGVMIIYPQYIVYADTLWGGRAAFPGFPTADGSSGSFFYPVRNILAMSSTCRNKEAAWDYIRLLITPRPIGANLNDKVWISVNKDNYEKNMRKDLEQMEGLYRLYGDWGLEHLAKIDHFTYGDGVPLMRLPTEDDIQRLDTLVEHTTRIYWPEDDLTDIVWETLGAYFAGDRTLDDTIGLLGNRVSLYLHEQQ